MNKKLVGVLALGSYLAGLGVGSGNTHGEKAANNTDYLLMLGVGLASYVVARKVKKA